ncbi:transcriptional regulator, MerR family [Actinobacteria bacterium OK074]|nr:transcriptional regulator, MerR family [Actinobacteria bacterium OK074]
MTADSPLNGRLDDDDYPAYTMGRAAEMLGTTPGFLRAIGEARLVTPLRSEGGHRRYSRYQLRIAARARELVDKGTPIEAACRIVILEDQLEEAQRINAEYRRAAQEASGEAPGDGDPGRTAARPASGAGASGAGRAGAGRSGAEASGAGAGTG